MSAAPSLRGAVRAALKQVGTIVDPPSVAQAEAFAKALNEELHAAGFAVHDVRRCVRPKGGAAEELGRAMTQEEAEAFLGERHAVQLEEASA